MRSVNVVALVELPLQPRQANEHGKILPDVAIAQLDSLAHAVGCT